MAKVKTADVETSEDGGTLSVKTGRLELIFNKGTGALVEIHRNGKTIMFGNGPRFIAFRRNDRNYTDIAGPSLLTDFEARKEGGDVIVEAKYNGALQKALWKINPAGDVRLDYQYLFDGVVDMIGINFDFPENQIKGIRWFGMGPYRVWQNRLKGTRLDVWENTYNDSTPGESWVYPEFKGYFRDWTWANLVTSNGRIIMMTEAEDSYLGLYKPRDGKDGLLNLPDIDIAFLNVIPAMRNKFHTTDEIGPQSRPKHISGIKRGTIHFRFED